MENDRKIAIIGVLNEKESTNVHMSKAFSQMGFDIIPINYRTINPENLKEYTIFLLQKLRPELTILSKINGVNPDIITEINKYSQSFYWFMDNLEVSKQIKAIEYVKLSNFASATSSNVVDSFRKVNRNSYHIIEGYNPEIFHSENVEKDIDVLFFGSATDHRVDFFNYIKGMFNVEIYGANWPKEFNANAPRHLEELCSVINRSKIVLNLTHDDIIFSDRVVTTLGCGGFCLSEYCRDLDLFFTDGKHLVTFRNINECCNMIKKYLEDDTKRNEISVEGMKIARERFKWVDVVQRILHVIKE